MSFRQRWSTSSFISFHSAHVDRRRQAGLTQTDVAERLGRSQSFVAKYEGGERRLDAIEFLDISAAIKFSPVAIVRELKGRIQTGAAD